MAKIVKLQSSHPLVGIWISDEGDSSAEFEISPAPDGFKVTGRDRSDGEQFQISNVAWDGNQLTFDSLMPSTGYGAKHVLRLRSPEKVDHELTIYEVWKRKTDDDSTD